MGFGCSMRHHRVRGLKWSKWLGQTFQAALAYKLAPYRVVVTRTHTYKRVSVLTDRKRAYCPLWRKLIRANPSQAHLHIFHFSTDKISSAHSSNRSMEMSDPESRMRSTRVLIPAGILICNNEFSRMLYLYKNIVLAFF